MFPSRNMVDYGGEAMQYFPTVRMDADTSNTYNSPFQTPIANRYSSSTDSTSPDSYFTTPFQLTHPLDQTFPRSDTPRTYVSHLTNLNASFNRNTSGFSQNYDISSDWNFPMNDTQYGSLIDTPVRRQRAIIGRKILSSNSRVLLNEVPQLECEGSSARQTFWHSPEPKRQYEHLPEPKRQYEHSREPQRLYDLFPANDTSFDFHIPVKTPTDYQASYGRIMSPTSSVATQSCWSQDLSPPSNRSSYTDQLLHNPKRLEYTRNLSPPMTNFLQHTENLSPTSSRLEFNDNLPITWSNRLQNITTTQSFIPRLPELKPRRLSSQEIVPSKICMFCKKNGETPMVYANHQIKEKVGNKYRVVCPILRALVCTICGVSGDDAHTITYCPELKKRNNGLPLKSTTVTLKSTRIKSNGTKRY